MDDTTAEGFDIAEFESDEPFEMSAREKAVGGALGIAGLCSLVVLGCGAFVALFYGAIMAVAAVIRLLFPEGYGS